MAGRGGGEGGGGVAYRHRGDVPPVSCAVMQPHCYPTATPKNRNPTIRQNISANSAAKMGEGGGGGLHPATSEKISSREQMKFTQKAQTWRPMGGGTLYIFACMRLLLPFRWSCTICHSHALMRPVRCGHSGCVRLRAWACASRRTSYQPGCRINA